MTTTPNPYYDEWCKVAEVTRDQAAEVVPKLGNYQESYKFWGRGIGHGIDRFCAREPLIHRYAFAVPHDAAIELLVGLGRIVEIGAGTGYWAALLRAEGATVFPYDSSPPGPGVSNHYFPEGSLYTLVEVGGPEKAAEHPDCALFLCWPPYSDSLAYDALCAYRGDTVVYVGEGAGGCTGDDDFHAALETGWEQSRVMPIPQWPGIHDDLYMYTRKGYVPSAWSNLGKLGK